MERVVLAAGADVLLAGMLLLSLAIPPVSMPSFPWSRSFSCAGEGQRTFLVLTAVRVVLGVCGIALVSWLKQDMPLALGDGKAGSHSSGSLQGQAPWVGVSCREDAHLLQTSAFP